MSAKPLSLRDNGWPVLHPIRQAPSAPRLLWSRTCVLLVACQISVIFIIIILVIIIIIVMIIIKIVVIIIIASEYSL